MDELISATVLTVNDTVVVFNECSHYQARELA